MRSTLLAFLLLVLSLSGFAQKYYLFAGTYTSGDSKGIYVYQFDAATGDIKPVSTIATENPSYLALSPTGNFLYAVNETNGDKPGGVSAFAFDRKTGQLQFLNKRASGGDDPCYVSVDNQRKWLMVANYNGGSLAALPILPDGYLGTVNQLIQHAGKGPDTSRQEKPHVHSVTFSPDNRFLIAADLGLDKLSVFRFNASASTQPLVPYPDSTVAAQPASGPRHISFYPGKPYVYLINEMGGAIDAFHYANGKFKAFQRITTIPEGYTGENVGSADIHVSPDARFLYASNRGDANNIVIYSIDKATGKLELKGFQSSLGKTPRNFIIDPEGKWLLVANQRSDNIVIFRIDPKTGLLTQTGEPVAIPSPVCLKLLKE
jgi:6-phosphogluconolactonase